MLQTYRFDLVRKVCVISAKCGDFIVDIDDAFPVLLAGPWRNICGGRLGSRGQYLTKFICRFPEGHIFHINGDKMDFRKSNLYYAGSDAGFFTDGDVTKVLVFDKAGRITAEALIDTDDKPLVQTYGAWYKDNNGYLLADSRGENRKRARIHRLVMNATGDQIVDHINCDPLDNRKSNLRFVTEHENQQNRRGANKNSVTGVRGVSPEKRINKSTRTLELTGKFDARIEWDGTKFHLGVFDSIESAAKAIEEKKTELRAINRTLRRKELNT